MITFPCPTCQKKLSAKDTLAGKKFKCPNCGKPVAVPVPAPVPAAALAEERTVPPQPCPPAAGPEQPSDRAASHTATPPPVSNPDQTEGANQPPAGVDPRLIDFLAPAQGEGELGRLGKYRILKILGHGGMGVVYQAEDPTLKRAVALKAMLPTLAVSTSCAKRFQREAEAMAAVEHDHIVRIYQVDEDRGVPFLAMEFLKGEPLDERLQRQERLPAIEIVRIGREIAEALAAAHATGLIHRDIKPGNIWLERLRGRVKILDFGLARASATQDARLTQQGAIVGTPAYMAPEQGRGDTVDARCDLFSLGVVLYRLCCGQQPFRGNDSVSTLMAVAMHQPPAPSTLNAELPQELSDLVMQLLEKDPARRPASAADVVQVLQTLEKWLLRQRESEDHTMGLPSSAIRRTPAAVKPAAPRRRLALLLAGLVVLGGLIGLSLWASGLIGNSTPQGDYVIETDDLDFYFQVHKGAVTLEDRKNKRNYTLKVLHQDIASGQNDLEVTEGDLDFKTKTFTIKRGETVALKVIFEPRSIDDDWIKYVATLNAPWQVEAVVAKLNELNPGFDATVQPLGAKKNAVPKSLIGTVSYAIEGGQVTTLMFSAFQVKDLSPLRALPGLRILRCPGTNTPRESPLENLSPLRGLKLTTLDCSNTRVTDLSPLKGMPLKDLTCDFKPERDAEILRAIKTLETINGQPARELLKALDDKKP